MLADSAVADHAKPDGHERRASTQRAQAISWSSPRNGPMSWTDSGRPNGPMLNGSAMQGVPKRVQKRLKIGSPVLPRPDGASPLAEGASSRSNFSHASLNWPKAMRFL